MLVLSRQRDESIMIGDNIEITIVDIRGDKVRLGINAPNTVPVHRKEVYQAIQRERSAPPKAAAGTTAAEHPAPASSVHAAQPASLPGATLPAPAD
ncbi:MAG: carbon storage regulator CsrA [Phycisphaerae bacterium]